MTGRELAELFMFHQMQKPSNERMTIDQAERMIMAFAYDYHESEVKKLNIPDVSGRSEQLCPKCKVPMKPLFDVMACFKCMTHTP